MKGTARFTIRLPIDLASLIEQYAAETGIDKTAVIKHLLYCTDFSKAGKALSFLKDDFERQQAWEILTARKKWVYRQAFFNDRQERLYALLDRKKIPKKHQKEVEKLLNQEAKILDCPRLALVAGNPFEVVDNGEEKKKKRIKKRRKIKRA